MPTIKELVTELETIANAQPSLGTFIYGDVEDVNQFRNKQYPILLVDRAIAISPLNIRNFQSIFTFNMFWYDLDHRGQNVPKVQQKDIQDVALNFLKEFRNRSRVPVDGKLKWELIEDLNGVTAFRVANDRLIQYSLTVRIRMQHDCPTETFDYA